MKLGTLQNSDTQTLTQIPQAEIKVLWVNDYYDGPISGMAEYRGTQHLFEMIDRNLLGGKEQHRDYWLIALDQHQLQEETYWHELFCQHVGTYCDYTGRPPLPPDKVNQDAFFEPYSKRIPPDYKDNEVVGWFRL